MNNKTRKWIRAGIETFIHGGLAAVTSSATASFIDPKDWSVGSANQLKLAGFGFLVNGTWRLIQWWQNNPLPESDTDAGTAVPGAPTQVISISPLGKVVPMSQQPPVQPPQP